MREGLAQQHKQNERIRKDCELQRITMAVQRAAMKLQRESGQREVKSDPPLESPHKTF